MHKWSSSYTVFRCAFFQWPMAHDASMHTNMPKPKPIKNYCFSVLRWRSVSVKAAVKSTPRLFASSSNLQNCWPTCNNSASLSAGKASAVSLTPDCCVFSSVSQYVLADELQAVPVCCCFNLHTSTSCCASSIVMYSDCFCGFRHSNANREIGNPPLSCKDNEIFRINVRYNLSVLRSRTQIACLEFLAKQLVYTQKNYSRCCESIQMVTGPSLINATCMSAPKRPVSTLPVAP